MWHEWLGALDELTDADLKGFDFLPQLFLGSPEFFLKASQQLVVFALGKLQVIIGELSVFLLELTLHFVPTPFELQFRHSDNCFACGSKIGRPLRWKNATRSATPRSEC